jgi:hypothetical protein
LNRGDASALAELGVSGKGPFPMGVEYGLGDAGNGVVVVVRGGAAVVDWAQFPGIKPLAHTHPRTEIYSDSKTVRLNEILKDTTDPLRSREQVFPSGADFIVMAQNNIAGHVVYTEFVIKNGVVRAVPRGDTGPRVNFTIVKSGEYGINSKGEIVYQATVEMRSGHEPVTKTLTVYIVQTAGTADGHIFMSKPKGVMEKPPGGWKNPAKKTLSVDKLDPAALKNLSNGLDTSQVTALITKHGFDSVEWAGKSLDGTKARKLLEGLQPKTVAGVRDVTAREAHAQLTLFGAATMDKIIPPVTGKHLESERRLLGDTTAKALIEDKVHRNKIPDIVKHSNQLDTASAATARPMGSSSLAVDSNVIIGVQELLDPKNTWSGTPKHKKAGVNYLRSIANPVLPPLGPTDVLPVPRTIAGIIGTGHDLRGSNVTRGETTPTPGMPVGELPLTVARNGVAYNAVLKQLADKNIGKGKGGADRGVVADTIFSTAANPELMTGDMSVIGGVYENWGIKDPAKPVAQRAGEKVADAVARVYPTGYDADVPNGTGGTRRIRIIPMR